MQQIKVGNTYCGDDGRQYLIFSRCNELDSYCIIRLNLDAWVCTIHGAYLDNQNVLHWESYTGNGFLNQVREGAKWRSLRTT